jgi:hypothetical protein
MAWTKLLSVTVGSSSTRSGIAVYSEFGQINAYSKAGGHFQLGDSLANETSITTASMS